MKNIKIGIQLIIGYAILLILATALGLVSIIQTNKIHEQMDIIYKHPLQVRRAIDNLQLDIQTMRIGTRDLVLVNDEEAIQKVKQDMEVAASDAHVQFDILHQLYLGPMSDVDDAFDAFITWKTAREINNQLAINKDISKLNSNLKESGATGKYRNQLIEKIGVIDSFAQNMANSLYSKSHIANSLLNKQMILILIVVLLLSFIVNYILIRNIRSPLKILTNVTQRFINGDLNARSSYSSKNEFGTLSDSYNKLANNIQSNLAINKQVAELADLMLTKNQMKDFFHSLLSSLATITNSQLAALYLLNEDKTKFEHYDSIGLSESAIRSFNSKAHEGEFGLVLGSHKVEHIKNIPSDTQFIFKSVSGDFVPKEIITIPIISNAEIIAIISLAGLSGYQEQTLQLIEKIELTLSARVAGILDKQKLTEFSQKLEQQNIELETQKNELTFQSAELLSQNSELEMQKKQLNEANRMKTIFLSNMSHELRTPLNSVIALSGVLTRRLKNIIPEEEHSYLEVIERNGKHLLDLINDILDLSRIESGKEELEITRFNLANSINEIISILEPQIQQRKNKLLFTGDKKNISVTSDERMIRHILQNLIGNAVKFTEKGKIRIHAEQDNDFIKIMVSDTGIGISAKDLPHIFDEFRQADSSTSRKYGGTGLGLAIAKKYTSFIGGSISVESEPEKGSAFTLTIPVNPSNNAAFDQEVKPTHKLTQKDNIPVKNNGKKTILLIEDSEPAIIQIKDILEDFNYELIVANNGELALEILQNITPDGIILDLMMPVIDGFEVLGKIRENESTIAIPVLILTAKHITKEELNFLRHNKIYQLIRKGDIRRNELLQIVASMINPAIFENTVHSPVKNEPGEIASILIVEDNPDNMLTIKAILSGKFRVYEAFDGETAIKMAKEHIPNLIIMDIQLPGMNGIEAFRIIRNDSGLMHIPIIALTASAMTSDRETILAHGFDAYLTKPVEERDIFDAINKILYGK